MYKRNKKINPNTLLNIDICYEFTGAHPNLYKVNTEGKYISRPHVEIRKLKKFINKYVIETQIQKPGIYKFNNFKIPKYEALYSVFGDAKSGLFSLDSNKEIKILEIFE